MPNKLALVRGLTLVGVATLTACRFDSEALPEPAQLASPAGPGAAEPNLTISPSGAVFLSWLEPAADSTHALRFSALADSTWTAPRTIAAGRRWFVNWADFPSLLARSDSDLTAHWLVRSAGGRYDYDVQMARSRDAGATWSAAVIPHQSRTGEHGFVSMWPAAGDGVGLVWLDGGQAAAAHARMAAGDSSVVPEMTLRAATFGGDLALRDTAVVDPRICDCCQTSAAASSEGPVVVYRDRSPGEIRDIYVTRLAGGRWTEGRPVAQDGWEIHGCPVNGPAVAADGRRVVVAWFTAAREERRVYAAFSDDAGATFGGRIRVDDGAPVGRVGVVLDADGRAIVSWLEEAGGAGEVRVRRVAADSTIGPATVVARTGAGRPAGFPRIARSGDRLVFAWTVPTDGGPTRVHTALARLDR